MIRRLLRLERQLASSRLSSNIRHNASLKNHCCSRRITNDLESTTDKLKRGLNFAHRLLGNHHVRAGRRHKATKGSLSLLKRQQIKASRQRLTLKKQLRRALAQQSLLERQMERLQQILDVVLQVSTDCIVTHALKRMLCVLSLCCLLVSVSGYRLTCACITAVASLAKTNTYTHVNTTLFGSAQMYCDSSCHLHMRMLRTCEGSLHNTSQNPTGHLVIQPGTQSLRHSGAHN